MFKHHFFKWVHAHYLVCMSVYVGLFMQTEHKRNDTPLKFIPCKSSISKSFSECHVCVYRLPTVQSRDWVNGSAHFGDLWSHRAGINKTDWKNMVLLGTVRRLKNITLLSVFSLKFCFSHCTYSGQSMYCIHLYIFLPTLGLQVCINGETNSADNLNQLTKTFYSPCHIKGKKWRTKRMDLLLMMDKREATRSGERNNAGGPWTKLNMMVNYQKGEEWDKIDWKEAE